jgi:hypothetical protein
LTHIQRKKSRIFCSFLFAPLVARGIAEKGLVAFGEGGGIAKADLLHDLPDRRIGGLQKASRPL